MTNASEFIASLPNLSEEEVSSELNGLLSLIGPEILKDPAAQNEEVASIIQPYIPYSLPWFKVILENPEIKELYWSKFSLELLEDTDILELFLIHNVLQMGNIGTNSVAFRLFLRKKATEPLLVKWLAFVEANAEEIADALADRTSYKESFNEAAQLHYFKINTNLFFSKGFFSKVEEETMAEWVITNKPEVVNLIFKKDQELAKNIINQITDLPKRQEIIMEIISDHYINANPEFILALSDAQINFLADMGEGLEYILAENILEAMGENNRKIPQTVDFLRVSKIFKNYSDENIAIESIEAFLATYPQGLEDLTERVVKNPTISSAMITHLKDRLEANGELFDHLINYAHILDLSKFNISGSLAELSKKELTKETQIELIKEHLYSSPDLQFILTQEHLADEILTLAIKSTATRFFREHLFFLKDLSPEKQTLYYETMIDSSRLGQELFLLDRVEFSLISSFVFRAWKENTTMPTLNQQQYDLVINQIKSKSFDEREVLIIKLNEVNTIINLESSYELLAQVEISNLYAKDVTALIEQKLLPSNKVLTLLDLELSKQSPAYNITLAILSNYFSELSLEQKTKISNLDIIFLLDDDKNNILFELLPLSSQKIKFKTLSKLQKETLVKSNPNLNYEIEPHHTGLIESREAFNFFYRHLNPKEQEEFTITHIDVFSPEEKSALVGGLINKESKLISSHFDFIELAKIALASDPDDLIKDYIQQKCPAMELDLKGNYPVLGANRIKNIINTGRGGVLLRKIIEDNFLSMEELANLITTQDAAEIVLDKISSNKQVKTRFIRALKENDRTSWIPESALTKFDFLLKEVSWVQFNSIDIEYIIFTTEELKVLKTKFLELSKKESELSTLTVSLLTDLNLNESEILGLLQKSSAQLLSMILRATDSDSIIFNITKSNPSLLTKLIEETDYDMTYKMCELYQAGLTNVFKMGIPLNLDNSEMLELLNNNDDESILALYLKNDGWRTVKYYNDFIPAINQVFAKTVSRDEISKETTEVRSTYIIFKIGSVEVARCEKDKNKKWVISPTSYRVDLAQDLLKFALKNEAELPVKVIGHYDLLEEVFVPKDSQIKIEVYPSDNDEEKLKTFKEFGLSGNVSATAVRLSDWTYSLDLHFEKEAIIKPSEIEKEVKNKSFNLAKKIESLLKINARRRWGFELELAVRYDDREQIAKVLRKSGHDIKVQHHYGSTTGNQWEFKTDTSLNENAVDSYDDETGEETKDGDVFEIASPILSGKSGIAEANKLLTTLFQKFEIESGEYVEAGLHVHHEIKDILNLGYDEDEIIRSYLPFQETLHSMIEGWRNESKYCQKIDPSKLAYGKHNSRLDGGSSGILLTPYGTMEFRMKEGVTSVKEILNWIIYTQSIVEAIYHRLNDDLQKQHETLEKISEATTFLMLDLQGMGRSAQATKEKIKKIRKLVGMQEYLYAS